MSIATHELRFDGQLLRRGFWLYVWEIMLPDGAILHYVGRTGDSSSLNAQSPFVRMGQHLGFRKASNMLRKHVERHHRSADECTFRLIAHGPLLDESKDQAVYRERRDRMAAMEKALAEDMVRAGYTVMNPVKSRHKLDTVQYTAVRQDFARHFPRLAHIES